MATVHPPRQTAAPAVVAKPDITAPDHERYLLMTSAGRAVWIEDPEAATAFASMREAARMALRLPSGLRAFGLPREVEVALHGAH